MPAKPGRNDPCPCGSGKKFKRCCLPLEEAAVHERAQQRALFAAFDDDVDADADADADDLQFDMVDDWLPLDVRTIRRICYTRGMVDTLEEALESRELLVKEWLLVRNTPPVWPCAICAEPATVLCSFCFGNGANPFACRTHKRRHACGERDGFMPVVNSPRMGVCGYTGD